jgi:curved DNA-binding protein CbpA
MEISSRFNYYDVLEVNPHCQQHEITIAYEKAKNTYSGENPSIYTIFSRDEARELLTMVEEAYKVLGNKTLRSVYDEKITQGGHGREELTFEALDRANKVQLPESKKRGPIRPIYEPDEQTENEIKTRSDWDGPALKKIREYKNISLERLSEITKINPFYINAIEIMDSANLPAPVFVRGYVSQISRLLGLNETVVCSSYINQFKKKA